MHSAQRQCPEMGSGGVNHLFSGAILKYHAANIQLSNISPNIFSFHIEEKSSVKEIKCESFAMVDPGRGHLRSFCILGAKSQKQPLR